MQTFREQIFSRTRKERKSIVGGFRPFKVDIFRERFLTPHEEMRMAIDAYNYNTLVQSAVNTMTKFIIGNEIKVVSDDDATVEFLQKVIDNTQLKQAMREVVENTIKTGNGWLEMDWENEVPVRFYAVADASRMYINFDKHGNAPVDPRTGQANESEFYLQRVDMIYQDPDARYYELGYHISMRYYTEKIKAIPIHKKKLIHFKFNVGDDGVYGRSFVAAGINDYEMLREMERSIALIAKYKAVPKKILTYGDRDNPANDEEVIGFANYLENLEREENAIVNKPFKVDDLTYSGQDIDLSFPIEHARKKLVTGIAPEFILGFSKDTNRATAHTELTAYILSIMSDREIFLEKINETVLKPYIKKYNLKEAKVEFGELDFEDISQKAMRIAQMWQGNMITRNEARELLGFDLLEKDEGDKFSSEIEMGAGLLGGMPEMGEEPEEEVPEEAPKEEAPEEAEEAPEVEEVPFEMPEKIREPIQEPISYKPERPTAQPLKHLKPKIYKEPADIEVDKILSKKSKVEHNG